MNKESLKSLVEKVKNRDEMAKKYAGILAFSNAGDEWNYLNKLIIGRWSLSGLKYIKRKAWG